ncbi:GTPase ObgE [Vallitalea okinawensis]|uniref:GTPase ObgE n=1 Tax=Vallitalea okinawensis TaxID=2078660 RepID=UPI000CFD2F3A|nr:GTPase ObgE [Vallitalea okinawensis]
MFVDQVKIYIESGRGGDGIVSFRREKYVPNGGPDGGDGGRGGDVIFKVEDGLNTLIDFRHKKHYKARSGSPGEGSNRHGKDADDMIIEVPQGTIIREAESGKVILDLAGDVKEKVLLKGGKGGKGNQHYATPTMQIPRFAQSGQDGIGLWVILELKMIADVGLVGFPNVGKSTFLSVVSNARPKIANYHFTTLQPNLGVVKTGYGKSFVVADIPGLIEGAHTGIGLGHEFLRHIERTKVLIHVVDASGLEGREPVDDVMKINLELENFNKILSSRPQVIAANKTDLIEAEEHLKLLKEKFEPEGINVFAISAATGKGVKELLNYVGEMLDNIKEEPTVFEQEYYIEDIPSSDNSVIEIAKDDNGVFVVEGEPVERMLGFTNLESEKGFAFFQKFMREKGIIERLEELGIEEGDTVRLYNLEFDYYK